MCMPCVPMVMCMRGVLHAYSMRLQCVSYVYAMWMKCVFHLQCVQVCSMGIPSNVFKLQFYSYAGPRDPGWLVMPSPMSHGDVQCHAPCHAPSRCHAHALSRCHVQCRCPCPMPTPDSPTAGPLGRLPPNCGRWAQATVHVLFSAHPRVSLLLPLTVRPSASLRGLLLPPDVLARWATDKNQH